MEPDIILKRSSDSMFTEYFHSGYFERIQLANIQTSEDIFEMQYSEAFARYFAYDISSRTVIVHSPRIGGT